MSFRKDVFLFNRMSYNSVQKSQKQFQNDYPDISKMTMKISQKQFQNEIKFQNENVYLFKYIPKSCFKYGQKMVLNYKIQAKIYLVSNYV